MDNRAFEPGTPDMINLPLAIVELKHHLVADVGRAVLCRWSSGSQRKLQRMSHVKQDYSMAKSIGRYISELMHAEGSASCCKITGHLEDGNHNVLGYSTNKSHCCNSFDYRQEIRIHVFGSEILAMFESFLNLRSISLSLHQVESQGRQIVDEACGFPDTGESQVAVFSYCCVLGHR